MEYGLGVDIIVHIISDFRVAVGFTVLGRVLLGPPVLHCCRLFWRRLYQNLVGGRVPLVSRGHWGVKAFLDTLDKP